MDILDYCTTLWMRITLTLFTSGEFDLFCYEFFFRLLKSNRTLSELQDTKKSRTLTGIYKRQTDSFPVPFSSLTSTWEKDT